MKHKIPLIFDCCISLIVCFILGCVLGSWYVASPLNVVLFALLCSGCGSWLYVHALPPDRRMSDEDRSVRDQLIFSGDKALRERLIAVLGKKYSLKRCYRFTGVNQTALFCRVKPTALSADTVVDFAAYALKRGYDKTVILCDTASADAKAVASRHPDAEIKLLEFPEVLRLLKCLNALPEPAKKPRKSRVKASELFDKKRFKGYALGALAMLIFARFTRFSTYYLAVAALLIVLSAVTLLRKKA